MAYGSGPGKIQQLLKCSRAKAEEVFAAYHNLYKGTADYATRNIQLAKRQGYITGAFGLKLRTPGINARDEGKVGAEGRSLNNMTIQSYGLLTTKASILFQQAIEREGKIDDVLLINNIHDAIYVQCKANPETVKWVNDKLIECMTEDYIDNQKIKLTAELDIGYSWDKQSTIDNNISLEEIEAAIKELK
jgi:DNA polymerase-1